MRKYCLEILFIQNIDDRLANEFFRSTADHLCIGMADEAIAKIAT
jgi:hypothetical protein